MSTTFMREAVRISDLYCGPKDTDAVESRSRLQSALVLVLIMHILMLLLFWKLKDLYLTQPHIIKDLDVCFELTPPPPPKRISSPGKIIGKANVNPGSEAAPSPSALTPNSISPNALLKTTKPFSLPARPIPSHKTTIAPPIAITPNNVIKTNPIISQTTTAAKLPPPTTTAAVLSTQPLSANQLPGGNGVAGAGTGGIGQGGTGHGQGDIGPGNGFGLIATRLPSAPAMGNIAPYRKDLLVRLAQNWHPKKASTNLTVLITLAHNGHLVASEIFSSSGIRKIDKEALKTVEATEFAPLPEWYKGNTLTFKVQLNKVEAINQ